MRESSILKESKDNFCVDRFKIDNKNQKVRNKTPKVSQSNLNNSKESIKFSR